ncbi:MAG TPA: polysaccharide biosynthesis/export family protein [Planctomycetota bacterium]|nr:polysaccharide biosynthesis/export family protein [Planctomycetota bacterium]
MTFRLVAALRAAFPFAGLLFVASCSVTPPQEINRDYRETLERRRADYQIVPGDVLTVTIAGVPEDAIAQQTATVRPDGKIDLLHLHDFRAAGKTIPEVEAALRPNLVSGGFAAQGLEIAIDVLPEKPRVYLTGQFEVPGPIDFKPGMTIQDAIALGGGVRITADSDYVILRRPYGHPAGRSEWYRVDANDFEEEILLLPGDHIWVERNFAATVVAYLREYVFGIFPGSVWTAAGVAF